MLSGDLKASFLRFRSEGEVDALAQVFDATAAQLHRVAMHLVGRVGDADDLLQQTFVTAIERAHTFDPANSLTRWLAGILAMHARNAWRKRRLVFRADQLREEGQGVLDAVVDREERQAVEQALEGLPEPYREVLIQHFSEGKMSREIAARLRRAPGTVRMQIHRGLRLMRKGLPKGLITGGAVAVTETKGLAAIRVELLASAVKPSTVLFGAGGFVMGKKIVAGLLVVMLAGAAFVWNQISLPSGGQDLVGSQTRTKPVAVVRTNADLAGNAEGVEAAGDPSTAASLDRSEVDPAAPIGVIPGAVLVRGRVLGQGRRPVAGAAVTVGFWSSEDREVLSAADGSFSVPVPRPTTRFWMLTAVAQHVGQGGSKRAYAKEGDVEVDIGAVVLVPVHGLRVRVMQDGAPVAAALVALERADRIVRLATAVTGVNGEAFFEAAPERSLVVSASKDGASGIIRAVPPGDEEVVVEMTPDRDFEIHVTDAEDDMPIAGAAVMVRVEYWVPADDDPRSMNTSDHITSHEDLTRTTRTDESGVAWVRGVSAAVSVSVEIDAEGYAGLPQATRLRDDPIVHIPLSRSATRTVRWPVEAGEVASPTNGAELEVRFEHGTVEVSEIHTAPSPAFMERGEIVLPGVAGRAGFCVIAPDGAIARLHCKSGESVGDPVSFRRPRTIEVTVRDAAGSLVEAARVVARNQGNGDIHAPVSTDRNGVAVISGLYGGLVTVYVAAPGDAGRWYACGSVDLEQGDGRIEATLPSPARVRLLFWLDGVPGLPSEYRIHTGAGCTVEDEDPESAEVLVRTPVDSGFMGEITFYIKARGFLGRSVKASVGPNRDEVSVDVHLTRGGVLVVDVLRDPGEYVKLGLEHRDPQTDSFERATKHLSVPNGPAGSFRFSSLESGTYRVIDERSQRTSASVQIIEGQPPVRLTLDVGNAQWVSGHVITPSDVAPREVRIVVEADGLGATRPVFFQGSSPPGESLVREDGSFRVRIPGDRPVTVRPWHPRLQPALEGGVVTTTVGLKGVGLRLADDTGVVIPAPQLDEVVRGVRVGVGAPGGTLMRWFHAAYADGAIRFWNRPPHGLAAGRYEITLDPGSRFAPLVLPNLEIREGLNEFDPVTFEVGSTIRVQILTRDGTAPPRIYVRARRTEKPHYMRLIFSRGERVVELTGLGPGRFQVSAAVINRVGQRLQQEIAVDGNVDAELVLDLR